MGIHGFGSLRDRFASIATVRDPYIACFDVTPLVVYAIRNSQTEHDFMRVFRYRVSTCREITFLRQHPPRLLRYTLDNKSPRAKRQTQLQRIIEARSLLSRMSAFDATAVDTPVDETPTVATTSPTPPPLDGTRAATIDTAPVRCVVMVEGFAHGTASSVSSPQPPPNDDRAIEAATAAVVINDGDDNTVATLTTKRAFPPGLLVQPNALRISDMVSRIREILLTEFNISTSLSSDSAVQTSVHIPSQQQQNVQFDYDEGEGEIKALNWLDESSLDENEDRLIMARDNDVYVYLLTKLNRDSARRYLVYHESSDSVLHCWGHFSHMAVQTSCWMLQLWITMCFGNDFVYGLLDRNGGGDTIQQYYGLLEAEFLHQAQYNAATPATSGRRGGGSETLSPERLAATYALYRRDDRFGHSRSENDPFAAPHWEQHHSCTAARHRRWRKGGDNCLNALTKAIWLLQCLLRGERRINPNRYYDAPPPPTATIVRRAVLSTQQLDDNGSSSNKRQRSWRSPPPPTENDGSKSAMVVAVTASRNNYDVVTSSSSSPERGRTCASWSYSPRCSAKRRTHDLLRLWVARQMWSLFYTLELPTQFSQNEQFKSCPAIRINTSFNKPHLHRDTFVTLDIVRIRKLIISVFTHGV